MSTTYTPAEWIAETIEEYGTYWLAVEPGTEHRIKIPEGEPYRVYGIRCASGQNGSIHLSITGPGEGSAHASRFGDGDGNARATRSGSGEGDADAFRSGSGEGNVSADRYGSGEGLAYARRDGSGEGSAYARRDGSGEGSATAGRDGSGEGDADAFRYGAGAGSAIAYRYGAGAGCATETDSCGTRRTVAHPGIVHPCLSGDGYLRVGCEIHTLSDWISDAEEVDARHGDGIAELTRALATRLLEEG